MSSFILTGGYGDTHSDEGGGGAGEFVNLELTIETINLSFTAITQPFNLAVETVQQTIDTAVADYSFSQTTTDLTFNLEVIELC